MTYRRGTRATPILVVLALTALLFGCGGGRGSDRGVSAPPRDATEDGLSAPTTATGSVPSTVPSSAPGVDLRVSFLRGAEVGTAHRRVAPTQAVARAALEQLVAGPTPAERAAGLGTVIGPDTAIRRLSIADGVATIELDPDFGRGYNDATARLAQAQVVFTLTQFPTVRAVRFGAGGSPVSRADFADVTPAILVESVAPGDTVSSPVTVAGLNRTFESTVRVAVLGADRRVLADTFTTGRGEVGTWGRFTVDVPFRAGGDPTGFVVVWWDSPKDGSRVDVVEIPVRFG